LEQEDAVDDFVIEMMAKQRLAEARAEAARTHMASAHCAARPSLRVIVGRALVRLGARLGGTSALERHGLRADPQRS
jgi:hypothetical protein